MARKLRRYTVLGAIAAAVVAPALALGIAAPANALQAPPVAPPKLNVPSSVIGGATQTGASGAQLAGQIANGTKGSPAFPAGALTKTVGTVQQVIAAFNLGSFVGGAIDAQFGIDKDGTVCGATGDDFGGTVLRTLAGSDCSAYDLASTYTPNTDAPTTVTGSTLSFTSSDGKVYTFKVTGMTPAPSVWSQTKRAWCYQTTATGTTGTNASWSQASWKDPQGTIWGVSWGLVDPSGNVMMPAASGGSTPGGSSWMGTCADPTKITSATGIMNMAVETPQPVGYVVVRNYGGSYQKVPGLTNSGTITQTSSDPTRWLTCTIKTTDGKTYSATSDNFTEGSGKMAPTKCPTIPPTSTAGHMTITLNGGPQVLTLYDQDSTSAYQAAQTAYPACANGTCTLDLLDGTGSCYEGDTSRCATWMDDPNRDSKYTCKYGSYTAPIKECFALANAFDPAKVAAGNGLADPNTGADTGTNTSTKPELPGAPDPVDSGDTREPCFPSGYGVFNPINWVLQPVKCAMNWAFVPRVSKMNDLSNSLNESVGSTAIGGLQASMANWAGFGFGDGGCNGIPLSSTIYGEQIKIDLLKACPGDPLAPAANLTHLVISAAIITAGVLACLRYVANVFGFGGFGRIGPTVHGPRFGPAPESGAGSSTESGAARSSEYYVVYETGRGPDGLGSSNKRGIES